MVSIFLERDFDPPVSSEAVLQMAKEGFPCMQIYRVRWEESFLNQDGSALYCHFSAPDLEALRSVLRTNDATYRALWHSELLPAEADTGAVNVIVERSWQEPVNFTDIAAQEEAGAWCLETHNVKFLRSFFSDDQRRMICLYKAPDAESVRQSQIKAEMPFDSVWSFKHLTPDLFKELGIL